MTTANKFPIITPIPAFSDNYIWAIQTSSSHCSIVDPGDSQPVFAWLETNELQLDSILITHHHPDHTDGALALAEQTGASVYAPNDSRLPASFQVVSETDNVILGGICFDVLGVPGHTLSHIAFYALQAELLFCGDALFSMGCGRMFEGTPIQMLASLDKLAALADTTAVYCTHEYTEANGRFALAVEPQNDAIQQRCQQVAELRRMNQPSLPVSLLSERQTNPFLRCDKPEVITAARKINALIQNRVDVFATLRRWKDEF